MISSNPTWPCLYFAFFASIKICPLAKNISFSFLALTLEYDLKIETCTVSRYNLSQSELQQSNIRDTGTVKTKCSHRDSKTHFIQ